MLARRSQAGVGLQKPGEQTWGYSDGILLFFFPRERRIGHDPHHLVLHRIPL